MSTVVNEVRRRERLERLFSEHAEAVHAYARRRIDAASAQDTVAEVFSVAWRRLDDVSEHALPWLLAAARRVLANQRPGGATPRGAARSARGRADTTARDRGRPAVALRDGTAE